MRSLLEEMRSWSKGQQRYAPANLVALLRLLRGHLREQDLSWLAIRGTYLQGIEMQDTRLAGARLQDCVFTSTFGAIWAVATSSSGEY